MSQAIRTDIKGHILSITIDRPEAKNAVNKTVAEGLAAAMNLLDDDDALRVGIITGAGGNFCSGMDLKGFLKGETPIIAGRGFAGITETPPQKPLIAAVDGCALAGGMEIALCCDIIVASQSAKFGIPEVKRGMVAGAGGLIRLPRQIPSRLAMQYALTGEFVDAERAYEIGLINLITDSPAIDGALKLAHRICENGPLAVRTSKSIISRQSEWSSDDMWTQQRMLLEPVSRSRDVREGAAAFAEKRKPNWTGT